MPIDIEAGSMARTIPTCFVRVPFKLAAQVWAARGDEEHVAALVFIYTHLFAVYLHDTTMAVRQGLYGGAGRGEHLARKPLDGLEAVLEKGRRGG